MQVPAAVIFLPVRTFTYTRMDSTCVCMRADTAPPWLRKLSRSDVMRRAWGAHLCSGAVVRQALCAVGESCTLCMGSQESMSQERLHCADC